MQPNSTESPGLSEGIHTSLIDPPVIPINVQTTNTTTVSIVNNDELINDPPVISLRMLLTSKVLS